jgi:hypothetical protein
MGTKKPAPFFSSFLITLGVILFVATGNAQTVAYVYDTVCDNPSGCGAYNGPRCESTTFTVPEIGNYCLNVDVDIGDDSHCHGRGCASIYNGTTVIATEKSLCENSEPPCEQEQCSIGLSTGITYTLYICLVPCDVEDCGDIDHYSARAKVWH